MKYLVRFFYCSKFDSSLFIYTYIKSVFDVKEWALNKKFRCTFKPVIYVFGKGKYLFKLPVFYEAVFVVKERPDKD